MSRALAQTLASRAKRQRGQAPGRLLHFVQGEGLERRSEGSRNRAGSGSAQIVESERFPAWLAWLLPFVQGAKSLSR